MPILGNYRCRARPRQLQPAGPRLAGFALPLLVASACAVVAPTSTDAASDTDDVGVTLPATEYCERTAQVFCPFYLRCGRIAEPDLDSCTRTFLEVCNQVYEPRYAALTEAGLLELVTAGVELCAQHLAQVPCDDQPMDVDGPCLEMWRGRAASGAACGVGIESFVCNPQSTCILSLSLCGLCEPTVPTGAACGDGMRCRYQDRCQDGSCVVAPLPGESCANGLRCVAGAGCSDDVCVARTYVSVGDPCDSTRRCPYRSTCAGQCVRSALLGETCGGDVACASGFCDSISGTCRPFLAPGMACHDRATCQSGSCEADVCTGLVSTCLQPR